VLARCLIRPAVRRIGRLGAGPASIRPMRLKKSSFHPGTLSVKTPPIN
jgi:hypothetical protein